jgi:hypothetical protein
MPSIRRHRSWKRRSRWGIPVPFSYVLFAGRGAPGLTRRAPCGSPAPKVSETLPRAKARHLRVAAVLDAIHSPPPGREPPLEIGHVRLPALLRLADRGDRCHLRLSLRLADAIVELGEPLLVGADRIAARDGFARGFAAVHPGEVGGAVDSGRRGRDVRVVPGADRLHDAVDDLRAKRTVSNHARILTSASAVRGGA